jgi:hypothetical protein
MRKDDNLEIEREMTFGENFSGTFIFIRENAGPLFKSILLIAGPFILLSAILLGLLFPGYFDLSGRVDSGPFMDATFFETYGMKNILRVVFFLLTTSLISMVTFEYVYLYTQSEGKEITFRQVWERFRKDFFRLFAAKLIMWPAIIIASGCLALPGIVLYVLWGGTELIIIEKRGNPFSAISQSYKLMKQYWGTGFVLMLLLMVIISVLWVLFSIPAWILEGGQILTTVEQNETGQQVAYIIHAVSQVIVHLLFLLPTIAIALRYYSVKEEHYREGIVRRIRSVGKHIDAEDIYKEDEQY